MLERRHGAQNIDQRIAQNNFQNHTEDYLKIHPAVLHKQIF
jgi:hypothetical protein